MILTKIQVVVFHCIQQAYEGGDSLFCDGFEIARQIRDKRPEDFKVLCETDIEYVGWGVDHFKFHHVNRTPVFRY